MVPNRDVAIELIGELEASNLLDTSYSFLMRMVRARTIPHYALPDGQIKFDKGELLTWLRNCHCKPEANP